MNAPPLRLRTFFKTSVIVFSLLVGAKFMNFLKKILIGQLFGVSATADAFFAASFLPYYLAIFFEGVIFLGVLPLFAQVKAEKGETEAGNFLTEVLFLIFGMTSLMAILGWFFAPRIILELVPGFNPSERALTTRLFQTLSLVVIFISLTSFFKALNSYFEHYAWAASSALVDSLVMIGLTLLAWKIGGIQAAAWAAVAGAFSALLQQAFFLFKKHPLGFRPIGLRNVWVGKLFIFLLPMLVIWGFQQIPLVILNRFGSGMWEGTISALTISHTLSAVPMGLVSHTVLFAIFPSLARQASDKSPENVRRLFFQTLRGGFLILIPTGFILTAFARPLAALFFDGGGISAEGTKRIANSLACFGWSAFALYADLFMTQSLIAVRKTLPAILLGVSRAVLTYGLGYVLSTVWDYQGLALSFSLALVANLFIFFPFFFKMSPFKDGWKDLFRYAAKLLLASVPALLAGWLADRWSVRVWMDFPSGLAFLMVAGGSAALGVLYLRILLWLKVEEIRSTWEGLKESWARKGWWLAEQSEG